MPPPPPPPPPGKQQPRPIALTAARPPHILAPGCSLRSRTSPGLLTCARWARVRPAGSAADPGPPRPAAPTWRSTLRFWPAGYVRMATSNHNHWGLTHRPTPPTPAPPCRCCPKSCPTRGPHRNLRKLTRWLAGGGWWLGGGLGGRDGRSCSGGGGLLRSSPPFPPPYFCDDFLVLFRWPTPAETIPRPT